MEITAAFADELAKVAQTQLSTSRQYKAARLKDIKESEDLYLGIATPSLRNPFNECFPFMSGFVDTGLSNVDEPPTINFDPQEEADYKSAMKISAAFQVVSSSTAPEARWALKDRWATKLAMFGGRAIYSCFAESEPEYKNILQVKDYYEFHCEPNGGGHLANHLFKGEDAIFKTKEDLVLEAKEGLYDAEQVAKLITNQNEPDHKDNEDAHDERLNRQRALGLNAGTNNYTGQALYRFAQWVMKYKGEDWYLLFDVHTGTWIRVKPLKEVWKSGLDPYVSWATHEDPAIFWSKAPCDDARPIARTVNRLLNQELYYREKKNHGQRFYDPNMIIDLKALEDSRPDGLVPVKVGPNQTVSSAVFRVEQGELNGTIDLVSFLDAFSGQKTGITPSSQGRAESDKKVGIFFGEMQQVQRRLGVYNRSKREAWAELGVRFMHGLDEHLSTEMAVKIMGAGGVEWTTVSKADLKTKRDLDIKVTGGAEEKQQSEIAAQKKAEALKGVQAVNPRWRDEQILKNAGFKDEDVKDAFEATTADRMLLSEAAQAEEDIVRGRTPKLNRGANAAFMQHILDFATDTDLKTEVYDKLIDYALAHTEIAAENEARNAAEIIKQSQASPTLSGIKAPAMDPMMSSKPSPVPSMPETAPMIGNP